MWRRTLHRQVWAQTPFENLGLTIVLVTIVWVTYNATAAPNNHYMVLKRFGKV